MTKFRSRTQFFERTVRLALTQRVRLSIQECKTFRTLTQILAWVERMAVARKSRNKLIFGINLVIKMILRVVPVLAARYGEKASPRVKRTVVSEDLGVGIKRKRKKLMGSVICIEGFMIFFWKRYIMWFTCVKMSFENLSFEFFFHGGSKGGDFQGFGGAKKKDEAWGDDWWAWDREFCHFISKLLCLVKRFYLLNSSHSEIVNL